MCGGGTQTTTQEVKIPPEVMARYNAVNARAEEVAKQPFQNYSGEFVAPLNPTQQAGVEATSQYSQSAQPYFGAATGLTLSGAQDVGALNQGQIGYYMNPYIQSVVDPTVKALQQQQGQDRAQQQAQAIKSGAYGGDRAGIQRAVLQGQQSLATSQAVAPLFAQGYQQAVNTAQGQQGVVASDLARRMQAGQQIANLGTAGQQTALQGAQSQIQAGTLGQQTQQALDTAKYQQFLQERGFPYQQAQFLANIAMGTGALSGSTTTTEQPAGFFSDERLKENIKKVGETNDGQPIYRYNYKGDPRTQIGLLAQDVEQDHPEAVGESHGYKTVDYKKATDDSVRAERAYGGGLDVNAFGGAVMDPGSYAGGGLVSDTDLSSILASQQKFFGPYGQGMAGQGNPYQSQQNIVPQASLPIPKLVTAGSAPSPRRSGLSQAAETGSSISGLYKGGKEALIGGKDEKGLFGNEGKWGDGYLSGITKMFSGDEKKAFGGGVSLRGHYDIGGGLPYGGLSQGYDPLSELIKQGPQHFELPKPGAPPKPQEPLKDAMQTGTQLYTAGKMGSAAVNKATELAGKMTGDTLTPIAPGSEITAMPVARPDTLGSIATGAEAPTTAIAEAAPAATATETLGSAVTAAPTAVASAAPVAETAATTLAAAAPEAAAGAAAGAEELLPMLLMLAKRGGRINAHHYAQGGVVPRQHFDDGGDVDPQKLFSQKEDEYGLPSGLLNRTWQIESSSGKNLGNDKSSARGHFQFIPGTAQMMGLKNPDDLAESTDAAARYAAQNRDFLRKNGILEPTAAQLYLAHQQGPLGAVRLLNAGDAPAGGVVGDRAVLNNAGDPTMKGTDFANKIMNMYSGQKQNIGDQVRAAQTEQKAGEKKDTGTNWEKILIPLLSGVGSAMASTRPTLGGALGEGLMGGIAGYKDISKLQADIPKTEAATQLEKSQAANVDMLTRQVKAGLYDRKYFAGYGWYVIDKENPGRQYRVTDAKMNPLPGFEGRLSDLGIDPSKATAGQEASGAGAPAGAGAAAAPAKTAVQPAPGTETRESDITKVVPEPKNLTEWKPLTAVPEGYVPANQIEIVNPDTPEKAKSALEAGTRIAQEWRGKAEATGPTMLGLQRMVDDYNRLPKEGLMSTGPTAEARLDLAKRINEASTIMGGKPIFDEGNVADLEAIKKGTFNLGAKMSNSIGTRTPGRIVEQAVANNPSITNSPFAFDILAQTLIQNAEYEKDRSRFYSDYLNKFNHLDGADIMFDRANPPKLYADRAIKTATENYIPESERKNLANYIDQWKDKDPAAVANARAIFDRRYFKGASDILAR